jgi:hypothetical protein
MHYDAASAQRLGETCTGRGSIAKEWFLVEGHYEEVFLLWA